MSSNISEEKYTLYLNQHEALDKKKIAKERSKKFLLYRSYIQIDIDII